MLSFAMLASTLQISCCESGKVPSHRGRHPLIRKASSVLAFWGSLSDERRSVFKIARTGSDDGKTCFSPIFSLKAGIFNTGSVSPTHRCCHWTHHLEAPPDPPGAIFSSLNSLHSCHQSRRVARLRPSSLLLLFSLSSNAKLLSFHLPGVLKG